LKNVVKTALIAIMFCIFAFIKNLILLFLLVTTAGNSKAWQVEIVNNSGCNTDIFIEIN